MAVNRWEVDARIRFVENGVDELRERLARLDVAHNIMAENTDVGILLGNADPGDPVDNHRREFEQLAALQLRVLTLEQQAREAKGTKQEQLLKAQATLERFKLGRATYVLGRRAGRLKMAFRGTQHMAGAANTLRTHPGEIRALVDEKVRASTQTAVNRVLGRQVKRYRKGRG